jgi:hypothetical protein
MIADGLRECVQREEHLTQSMQMHTHTVESPIENIHGRVFHFFARARKLFVVSAAPSQSKSRDFEARDSEARDFEARDFEARNTGVTSHQLGREEQKQHEFELPLEELLGDGCCEVAITSVGVKHGAREKARKCLRDSHQ